MYSFDYIGARVSNSREYMERFCSNLADNLRIGIMAAHIDGTICYMNNTFARMFGFDSTQAVGKDICRFFPNSALLDVMAAKKTETRVLFQYKGVSAFISRYPVLDGDTCVGGYVEAYFRDVTELHGLLQKVVALEERALYYENRANAVLPHAVFSLDDLVGASKAIEGLKQTCLRFANSTQPVLITGESGTGKELVANALHAASPRAGNIFVSVNCAAMPLELIEAELFGYKSGAFTGARAAGHIGKFELADGGSIFLDEIGELPLRVQAKLLRVLENHEIQKLGDTKRVYSNFRVIAATNRDLRVLVQQRRFRQDLYHRLSVLHVHIPPLRERVDDLPRLVPALLEQIARQEHTATRQVDPGIYPLLAKYAWPGNVRELKNVLVYAHLASTDGSNTITDRELPRTIFNLYKTANKVTKTGWLKSQRNDFVRLTIEDALERCHGNKSRAAQELGISRNELYKKIRQLNIVQRGGAKRA